MNSPSSTPLPPVIADKKHIHFIGVGGSGMYPLAQILRSRGLNVSGSDNNETETLEAVRRAGVNVCPLGQRAENIKGADLIVYTSAVMEDNPELIAARSSGVQILERAELLGIVTSLYSNTVCVSGTHGKTTVTSMITHILVEAEKSITAYIGGKLPSIGGSGISGDSETMICESCEFRDHFLKLYPDIAVILNIDADHLDYFGSIENVRASFRKFAEKASKAVIACGDDENTSTALDGLDKEIITCGKGDNNIWQPRNINYISGMQTEFDIYKNGDLFTHAALNIPGRHNVLNAVFAAAAASMCGASPKEIAAGLESFTGAGRRFEKYGVEKGVTVVDDYAHHPAEIAACLKAAKELDYKCVWAVFQPFTYSRTELLMQDFADALMIADKRVITSIMGGREHNDHDIHTSMLAEITEDAVFFAEEEHDRNFELVTDYVADNAQSGDLVVTLGCGDVNKAARLLLKKLAERNG